MDEIQRKHPSSAGTLRFLLLDLNDLPSIKRAAEEFASLQPRLDVLVNNAGVMFPPKRTKTKQGHDMQFGTNVLGPFLFTKLLRPLLVQTARNSAPGSVRVLWAASLGIQVLTPDSGVILRKDGPEILESQEAS